MRRFLLPIVLIPVMVGWIRLLGQQAGFYDPRFGLAMMVLTTVAMFVVLLLWTANGISRQSQVARDREERYELVLAGAEAAIWDWDVVQQRVVYSSRWRELRGLAEGSIGDSEEEWSRRIHPDDRDRVMAAARNHLDGNTAVVAEEYRIQHADGRWLWILDRGIARRDASGRAVRMAGSETDITERKRAEEALRDSEERYRRLTELLPVAVYTCEAPTGAITYFNENAARLWGRAPKLGDLDERFCGSFKMYLPDGTYLPHDQCPMAVALREGQSYRNQQVSIRRPDGAGVTVLVNIDPIRDSDGKIVGAINVFHDVSALHEAEQALREQKENVQTLLQTLPIPVFTAHDPDCRQISGNHAAAELVRMPRDANLSKSASQVERPSHFRILKQGRELAPNEMPMQRAARGEIVRDEEVDHEFDDGTLIRTLVSAQPVYDAQGRPRGAVACMLDITELRRAETALRASDRRKDEFLATLAHELRNPLAPIRNAVEILKLHASADPTLLEIGDIIHRQTQQMTRLVDDLLDLSRITHDRLELRKERVVLADVVLAAIETVRPLIDAKDHSLNVTLPSESLSLEADLTRLGQVFSNLLNNAVKYMDRGGQIHLQAVRDGDEAVVSVRDSGVGIPKEMLERIFEMFAQVDHSLERSQGGLGIGLTLTKRLVELHGGNIAASSMGDGQGSEFVVRLPLVPSWEPDPAPASAKEPPANLGSVRILVVDDNRDAAETLASLLTQMGCDAKAACASRAALALAGEFQPNVVFLDIGMPDMNGYDVCRAMRKQPWGTGATLIALTGWGQAEDKRKSQDAGFDDHLVKPVDFSRLKLIVADASSADDRVAAPTAVLVHDG